MTERHNQMYTWTAYSSQREFRAKEKKSLSAQGQHACFSWALCSRKWLHQTVKTWSKRTSLVVRDGRAQTKRVTWAHYSRRGPGQCGVELPSWGRSHVYPPMCCDHYFVSAHEQTEENMMDTEFKERFCEEVHGYLSLYMWSLKQYKNNKICTSSWMESAQVVE